MLSNAAEKGGILWLGGVALFLIPCREEEEEEVFLRAPPPHIISRECCLEWCCGAPESAEVEVPPDDCLEW